MCRGLLPSLGKETPNPSPAETGKLSGAGHWPGARRWQRPCLACSGPRPRVPMSPVSTPPRGLVRGAAEVLSVERCVTTWLTSPRSTTAGRGGKSMVVGLLTPGVRPRGKGHTRVQGCVRCGRFPSPQPWCTSAQLWWLSG